MRSTVLLLTLLISGLFQPSVKAEDTTISQGGVAIDVPSPEGFERLDDKTPEVVGLKKQLGGMGNDLLALYLRTGRKGVPEDYDRQFDVQGVKTLSLRDASKANLDALRSEANKQRETVLKETSAKLGMTGATMEPIHDFSDRHFSYVMTMPGAGGKQGCASCTTALIRGRLWLLYTRSANAADPKEVEWCKSTGKAWFASILAASPSDSATLEKEDRAGSGIFDNVGRSAVIGGIAGGIGAIVLGLMKKRKAKPAA